MRITLENAGKFLHTVTDSESRPEKYPFQEMTTKIDFGTLLFSLVL